MQLQRKQKEEQATEIQIIIYETEQQQEQKKKDDKKQEEAQALVPPARISVRTHATHPFLAGQIRCSLQTYCIPQAPKSNNFTFLSSACLLLVAGHGGRALLTHNQGLSQRWARFEAPQKSPS
jgi:hypothetical protein